MPEVKPRKRGKGKASDDAAANTTTNSEAKQPRSRGGKVSVPAREVLWPEPFANVCHGAPDPAREEGVGNGALTVQQVRDLLGWEEETEGVVFGDDYLFLDRKGAKVRLRNNLRNRPFYRDLCQDYVQEHLMRRWRLNGEPIIISRTGIVLNGQHSGVSLVLAEQERLGVTAASPSGGGGNASEWKRVMGHNAPLTMDKVVVFGIAETDDVVNTMDTCKPRSLADVLFRSEVYASAKPEARKSLARMTDYAIRMLWSRTGAVLDAFAPRRTHAEALDFIARHPTLVRCVEHIYTENTSGAIGEYLSPGYAAALMYLMASSTSDGNAYRDAEPRREMLSPRRSLLNFDLWNMAGKFWVMAKSDGDDPSFQSLRNAFAELPGGGTLAERIALFALAWRSYLASQGKGVSGADLDLDPLRQPHPRTGAMILAETPDVGGIDLGNPRDTAGDAEPNGSDREEIEARFQTEREAKKNGDVKEEEPFPDEVDGEANSPVEPPAPPRPKWRTLGEQLAMLKDDHPDRVLLFSMKDSKNISVWGPDAKLVAGVLGRKVRKQPDGMVRLMFPATELVEVVAALAGSGILAASVREEDGEPKVEYLEYVQQPLQEPAGELPEETEVEGDDPEAVARRTRS